MNEPMYKLKPLVNFQTTQIEPIPMMHKMKNIHSSNFGTVSVDDETSSSKPSIMEQVNNLLKVYLHLVCTI